MSSILHKLRSKLLSPNSDLELRFRTIYHHVNATRLAFFLKDHLSKKSTLRIKRKKGNERGIENHETLHGPLVTFILTVRPQEAKLSIRTIQSIANLTNRSWQLVILLPDETIPEDITSQIKVDDRLIFHSARSLALAELGGDYLVFCQAGDEFFPDLLDAFNAYYHNCPNLDLYYYDCEYFQEGQRRPTLLCKPSKVFVDFLLSVNYFSRGFIRKEFYALKASNSNLHDPEAIEYEIALFAAQSPDKIGHIAEVLVRQKSLSQPERPELNQIVEKHLQSIGLREVSYEREFQQPHFSWATNQDHVAIIIPTKDHPRLLQNLLSSIESTDYEDFNIYLIDNASTDDATLTLYDQLAHRQDIQIVPFNQPFNYSRAINLGASESVSELMLFLNDDMQMIHPGWLRELIQWAQRPEIGVVGTKLIRGNHTIQHAGIIMGLNAFAGHIYLNAPEKYNGLFGSVNWYRNYQALTGACQMVRRSVFEEVGGYDEDFRLAFGDIDFCLRVQALGYRNVYTPFACMYHFEGESRGYSTPISDINNAYEKFHSYLFSPDSHYSENLTLSSIPKYLKSPLSLEARKNRIEQRQQFYKK